MLDKIKVYRRSDAQEIDLETVRLGFGESLWLFVGADSSPTEQKLQLTKIDPLGKFKKEIEGWWFCEEYVIVNRPLDDIIIKCFPELGSENILQNICSVCQNLISGYNYQYNSVYAGRYVPMTNDIGYWCNLNNITNPNNILKYIGMLKVKFTKEQTTLGSDYHKFIINYSIGEDKYIKLLKLINQ